MKTLERNIDTVAQQRQNEEMNLLRNHCTTVEQSYSTARKTAQQKYQEAFEARMQVVEKLIEAKDLNGYYNLLNDMLVKKAIKLLQKANITVEYNRLDDVTGEARAILYEELANFSEYKRTSISADGKKVIEEVYEAWHELPAQMLFYVLSDRTQRRLRKYILSSDNLNNMLSLESQAESEDEESLLNRIGQACKALDRLETVDYLTQILSNSEYRVLQAWIKTGKLGKPNNTVYNSMKAKIASGIISPEQLLEAMPVIIEVEKEQRVQLAKILRKLAI